MDRLTPAQIQAFYSAKLKTLSSQTVRHFHTVLREALRHAVMWEMLRRNPADRVSPPRIVREKEAISLTGEQVSAFLDAAKGDRFYAAFVLAIYLGLRRGELLGLQWDDLDFEAGTLKVRRQVAMVGGRVVVQEPKTPGSRRVLVLDAGLLKVLAQWKSDQTEWARSLAAPGKPVPRVRWLFPALTGGPMSPQNFVRRHFLPLAAKAGLPEGIRLHDLRHTFATLAALGGVPMHVTARQLGHSTTRMTAEVYSHVLPEMQREVVRRVRAVVERNDTQKHNTQDHS